MKGYKTLTLKRILKRHKDNPQDRELHKAIETVEVDRKRFGKLIQTSTKHEPFDKK